MAKVRYNRLTAMWEVSYKGKLWFYRERENAEFKAKLCNKEAI